MKVFKLYIVNGSSVNSLYTKDIVLKLHFQLLDLLN